MRPKVLKALKGSIAKWEAIVNGTGVDQGTKNCPLCQLFNRGLLWNREFQEAKSCTGCPVFENTGRRYCDGTPYDDYLQGDKYDRNINAKREVEFLKSLLPENDE